MAGDCPVHVRTFDGRLKIGQSALEQMRQLTQDDPGKPEAGGVLLGRHILDTSDVIVDKVTLPMEGDRQSRRRFFRAPRRHQEAITLAWRESGGTCTYLGEWHTHPECVPTPSLLDRWNWRRKLLTDQFSGFIFFVIIGTKTVRVWEGHRHRPGLSLLERL
jgi:integrative and conjugative element protein (TIGR02256 family)